MATQTEVIQYIKSNYRYEEIEPGVYKLVFESGNGRTQTVFAVVKDSWLNVTSPYASVDKITADRALKVNDTIFGTQRYGDYFVLTHVAPLKDIDPSEIKVALGVTAEVADALEAKVSKQDNL
jgi:hypothetical protein